MSGELVLAAVLGILGAGGFGAVLVGRLVPQRTSREDRIRSLETSRSTLENRIASLDERLEEERQARQADEAEYRRVILMQADYIYTLRDLVPPPPPDWPEGLTRR